MSWRVPPWALARVGVLVALLPWPAAAVVAAVARSLVRAALGVAPLSDGDAMVGLPLALVLGTLLLAILVRSAQVWLGARSDLRLAFRVAPFVATAGAAIGFFAGPA